MTVLMTPDTADFAGNVHGGTLLELLDQAAYACASRYAAHYVATLSVDQVTFRQPVHVGELVTLLAAVNHTGTSSMERERRTDRSSAGSLDEGLALRSSDASDRAQERAGLASIRP
jgi:acyl-CoA hydrolase